jgi:hypothetical protein
LVPPAAPQARASSRASDGLDDEEVETVDDEPDDHHGDACAPSDPTLKPMQLLKLTWTSAIERRDPKDTLRVARPGERAYAHLRVRNRSGRERCLKLSFRVGGKERSQVTLRIGKSWNWRTWAYNTLKSDDRTPLTLVAIDDQGATLFESTLPVVRE